MSTLESIVLPLVDCRALVKKGIVLDTAMVWAAYAAADYGEWRVRERNRTSTSGLIGSVAAPTLTELVNAVRDKVGNPLEERTVILTHDGHREVACCAGVRSARGKYEIAYNDTDLQALATLLIEVSK